MKDLDEYWKSKISGKRILITGGSTGIGREITILLVSLGANCLICGRVREPIDETINEALKNTNQGKCQGIALDLAEREEIDRLFALVDTELGKIDVLINNAAIAQGSIIEGSYPDWHYALRINLLAYMACSHQAATRMLNNSEGHINNIGSMSADVREEGSSVYVATKSGIQGFSDALRKELNPGGIRVSLIEPGAVDTDMQPADSAEKLEKGEMQEMLKAEDIAMAVAFCLVQPARSEVVNVQIRPHLQVI